VLIVDDGILALLHQQLNEFAKIGTEFLPKLSRGHERIFARLFFKFLESKNWKK